MVVDQTLFGKMDHECHGVEQHYFLDFFRHHLQGIDDRTGIEKKRGHHFPNHGKVAEFHIQRRSQQSESQDDDIGENQKHDEKQNCLEAWHEFVECEKENDHQDVHQKNQGGING